MLVVINHGRDNRVTYVLVVIHHGRGERVNKVLGGSLLSTPPHGTDRLSHEAKWVQGLAQPWA